MSDLNSVIVEGVVTISPTNSGLFCIETTFYKYGGEVSIVITCLLDGSLLLAKSAELACRKHVRIVGYIDRLPLVGYGDIPPSEPIRCDPSVVGIHVEHLDVLSTVIKSGKYNFIKEN